MVATRTRDYSKPPPKEKPKEQHIDKRVPCSEFVLFQKLPYELRLMIWEASMTPRLVVARPRYVPNVTTYPSYPDAVPAHLSVNAESRQWGLRRYHLIFTITLIVDTTGIHRQSCPSFEGAKYRANIVMSPDDTLGFLGWELLDLGHNHWFRVEVANPLKCFPKRPRPFHICGTQPHVKNVALLGPYFSQKPKTIDVLNSAVSCSVDSLLHGEHNKLSRFYPPPGSSYSSHQAERDDKEYVLIHSRSFKGTVQEWGRRLLHRSRRGGLDFVIKDYIMAFELGKEPEEFTRPVKGYSPFEDPEGFYLSYEWLWRQGHPNSQGF